MSNKESFTDLWKNETINIDTENLAQKAQIFNIIQGDNISKKEYRRKVTKDILKGINRHEIQFGELVKSIISSRLDMKSYMESLKHRGIHEGYARLLTLKKFYSSEDIKALRMSTEGMTDLLKLSKGEILFPWKQAFLN